MLRRECETLDMLKSTILNVDDDEAARYASSRILRHSGYTVLEAATGATALRMVASEKPHLVVLDIHLPDMSGLEVCRLIKADPATATIPVLHITATFVGSNYKVKALDGGADSYLGGPLEPDVFLATVKALLRMRQAEEGLRRTEERFRRLSDSNVIGIISATAERITEANDAFLRMLGCSRQDLLSGKLRWAEITPPEHADAFQRAGEQIMTTGACEPFELECLRQDGSRVPVLIGSALADRIPEPCWVCFVLDLTERKRLEEHVRQTHKLEGIGLLAGGIAHDFNNLLTGIMGNASLALENLSTSSRIRGLLESVVQASERAADLTRQLLAYSGKGRYVVRRLNLSEMVQDISALLHTSISKKVELHVELEHNLPPIEADASQMQQLVMNLVINAAEAIGDKVGTVGVRTGTRDIRNEDTGQGGLPAGKYVYLEVQDTGCGMDEATSQRIFDPFFTTKFMGRGLGLAGVSGIVRGHMGSIHVESSPGAGSKFTVLLPAAAGQQIQPVKMKKRADFTGAGTILVIDDEEVVRMAARATLKQYGYTVLLAENGEKGIELFARKADEISLVLLDMTMPVMSGQETLSGLRAIRPDVRVLISSGYDEDDMMEQLSGEVIEGFIQKPYRSPDLAGKVKAVLETKAAPRSRKSSGS
jgi:two-component system CheB/CheR fusion protein